MVINKLYVAKFTGPNGKSIYLYFPPNDIYVRISNMEMSKQISAKLMSFITENETFVNLSQLAQYNGMTVKATEAIYRTANKESLAQILATISVEKNGKVNPSLKKADVQNADETFLYCGLLLFMGTLRLYTKQALSISEQIELLKSRGLNIADSSKAVKFLGEVSYFRFVQYLRPMEEDKTTHQFKPNSRFEDAVALYNFDIELRDLMFKAVQRLEIALRTKIIQEFSLAHGPFWFFDTSLADDEHKFIENMNSIDRELQRCKEDFIKEHRRNYDKPIFPPAWKTLELASFGTLSKLYYNFGDKKLKKRVARQFNLPQHEVLESWMRSVTVLRNCCAHHSRLWNRYLSNAPQMNASLRGAWVNIEGVDANKVYAIACCIAYWLDSMGYGLDFKNELGDNNG